MKNIAIFASGNGSNAENLIKYFSGHSDIMISRVYSNKQDAFVLHRAQNLGIDTMVFSKSELENSDKISLQLKADSTDFIVLAGFLLKIPESFINEFPNRIINIHPALLPAYGGKGMYGMNVHNAVKEAGDDHSGITIHFVNENYDEGNIIFQALTPILPTDTADDIASKIHQLEYQHFPKVVENVVLDYISKVND